MKIDERKAAFAAALIGLVVLFSRQLGAFATVSAGRLRELADYWAAWHGVDPQMVLAIIAIESGGNASAVRPEPALNDASIGVMQTLLGTAQWLWDIGYRDVARPDYNALLDASTSIYFGTAYLKYLAGFGGRARDEEWIVRSYNGGPGHSDAGTESYWRKYQAAKARL